MNREHDDRPAVRIGFAGFWDGFDPQDNFFTRLLAPAYRLEVVDRPDYLVYSQVGGGRRDHLRHDCTRIFFTGEQIAPDWNTCDWAFTFEHSSNPRHFRLPLWAIYFDPARLVKPEGFDPAAVVSRKTRFCGFVVSNPLCETRNRFFHKLSKYKPVDSGGKLFNTLGERVADKHAFLSECRFTIAFENESHPGYTTEKLPEAMLADSIPIYWGDPLVGRDFDTTSFLSAHDSASLDDLVDRVVAVEESPELQRQLLSRPWYRDNRVPVGADAAAILGQFGRIFGSAEEPIARRKSLVRTLGLHRLPAEANSIRRRLVRKYLKLRLASFRPGETA
jgi:hypothetical protein